MVRQVEEFGFGITLKRDFDVVLADVAKALKGEGFGVLTEIDVKATLKKKIDVDFKRYQILGACNPPLAYRALTTHPSIGLMLPCNVTVSENDEGGTDVAFLDPILMMSVAGNPNLEPVAQEARDRLWRVAEALEE